MKKKTFPIVDKEHINIFSINICENGRDCGWNISIGSRNKEALRDIEKILEKYGTVDMMDSK